MKTKLYILDNGYLECDLNWIMEMANVATRSNKNSPAKWLRIPTYSVLVDHPDRRFIFDLSCPPDAGDGHWRQELFDLFPYYHTEEQKLQNQLKRIGFTLEDIPNVILSHLHMDHAGNLNLFKHAKVFVNRKEFEHAHSTVQNPDPATHGAYNKTDLDVQVKEYVFFEDDFEFCPGVEIINLPGHTPGLSGLVVHLEKNGTLIFPSDSIYTKTNYGPPTHKSGIVDDSIAFLESVEKVRKLEKQYHANIMFSHDIKMFETFKKAPEYYE